MHDLLQRHRLGAHLERGAHQLDVRCDGTPAQLRVEQVQGLARELLQIDVLHLRTHIRLRHRMAQAAYYLGGAFCLFNRLLDGQLGGQQVGWILVQHTPGDLCVDQHRGQWLVQLMRHAGSQFAQCVEPGDLPHPQQFFSPAAVLALAQDGTRAEHQYRHQQSPAQHCTPGELHPADVAIRHHIERLAVSSQDAVEIEVPATTAVVARHAGLHHKGLPGVFEGHAHRADVRRHRPLAPGHDIAHVDQQRITRWFRAQYELIAPFGEVGAAQHGVALLARFGLGRQKLGVGPSLFRGAALYRQDLRVHRRQPLLRMRLFAGRA